MNNKERERERNDAKGERISETRVYRRQKKTDYPYRNSMKKYTTRTTDDDR